MVKKLLHSSILAAVMVFCGSAYSLAESMFGSFDPDASNGSSTTIIIESWGPEGLQVFEKGLDAGGTDANLRVRYPVLGVTNEVTVRSDPPQGWLNLPGEQVGQLELGARYVVLDTKPVPRFFELDTWGQLASVNDSGELVELGWAYLGPENTLNNSFDLQGVIDVAPRKSLN